METFYIVEAKALRDAFASGKRNVNATGDAVHEIIESIIQEHEIQKYPEFSDNFINRMFSAFKDGQTLGNIQPIEKD